MITTTMIPGPWERSQVWLVCVVAVLAGSNLVAGVVWLLYYHNSAYSVKRRRRHRAIANHSGQFPLSGSLSAYSTSPTLNQSHTQPVLHPTSPTLNQSYTQPVPHSSSPALNQSHTSLYLQEKIRQS